MANSSKIQYKRSIASYLQELKELTGKDIDPISLCSLEEIEEIRQKSLPIKDANKVEFTMKFVEKSSERFRNFIASLDKANNSSVYVWTDKSNVCGLYRVNSINAINFSFAFDVNTNGIVVFLTDDFEDKLLLDFYRDSKEEEMLEVVIQGRNWSKISF